jgi:DNA-binding NarL/FixJ family response regulator
MKPITILLAEDHMIVREGFHKMLDENADFHVVGEAEDGRRAVSMIVTLRPDIVLMDIAMPLLNGLEATRQAIKAVPTTKILILSAHNDDAYVQSAVEAGALGFLIKQTSAQDVCRAIRDVHKGKTFFSPLISRRRDRYKAQSTGRTGLRNEKIAQLTSREVEVLQLVAEGKANKQVAAELGISTKTVEKHRDHLMQKLDIHDTASLTRYAISAGIVECDVPLTLV